MYYLNINPITTKKTLWHRSSLSEIFLPQLFRRRILASGQDRQQTLHTCYFWQAASAGVQSTAPAHSKCAYAAQKFLTGKTDKIKRVQQGLRDTTTWLGIFLELNAIDSDVLSGIGVK